MRKSVILTKALTLLNPSKLDLHAVGQWRNYLCHCVAAVDLGKGQSSTTSADHTDVKGNGFEAERTAVKIDIASAIEGYVSAESFWEHKTGVCRYERSCVEIQEFRRKLAEELIEQYRKEEDKISNILREAKKILANTAEETETWRRESDKKTKYICFAIARSRGESYDLRHYWSAGTRAAIAVIESYTKRTENDYSPMYERKLSQLHGVDKYREMSKDDIQAARHRLLDFLILEFSAVGN